MRGPGRPGVRRRPGSRSAALRLGLLAVVPVLLTVAPPATADPGVPDPTFGAAGTATASGWPDAPATGRFVTRAGNGALLVAGRSGRGDVVLERLRTDGTPDATFGSGGRVVLDLGSVVDTVVGVDVDPQGRVLVGGGTDDAFVLRRLLADGRTDPSYGTGGEVRVRLPRMPIPDLDVPGGNVVVTVQAMGVAANGDAMLAGLLGNTGQDDHEKYALLRVDASGHPAAGFGVDGVSRTAVATDFNLIGADGVEHIAMQDDGSALITGRILEAESRFIRRVRPDGTVDRSYRPSLAYTTEGFPLRPSRRRRTDAPSSAFEVLPDGRTVLARTGLVLGSTRYEPRTMLLRNLPSGAPDTSFGDAGVVLAPDIVPPTAKLGPDGAVYVLTTGGAVRRYAPDGTLDSGFSSTARGEDLVRDPDGLTVVALDAGATGTVRRTAIGWDGAVRDTRSAPGALRGGAQATVALAAAQQSGGKIVELTAVGGREGGLTRLTATGTVDRSFGTDGVVAPPTGARSYAPPYYESSLETGEAILHRVLESRSLSVAADDRILVATPGPAAGGESTGPVLVRRFLADGAPDPTWGTAGVVTLADVTGDAPQVGAAPGGGATVLGKDGDHGVLVRLTRTGAVDTTWGTNGRVRFVPPKENNGQSEPDALQDRTLGTLADGRIVAAGRFGSRWFAARFLSDGRPDTSYGRGGWTFTYALEGHESEGSDSDSTWPSGSARSATVAPDGRVLVADLERRGARSPNLAVRVIAADGKGPDPQFAPALVADDDRPDFDGGPGDSRVTVQADGRIVAAFGSPPPIGGDSGSRLTTVRYEPDGRLDRSFGDDGVSRIELEDRRAAQGWPTDVLALRDGRALVLGDADGDAAALALAGGGPAATRRPVLRTYDLQLPLAYDAVAAVPLALSAPSATPVTVRVRTEDGGDRADPVDRTVTIPAGETRVAVPVRVRKEGDPAVVLRATSDDVPVRRRSGDLGAGASSRIQAIGSPVAPSPSPGFPPVVALDPATPSRARCTDGSWTGTNPRTYTREWLRAGTVVAGETGETIAVTGADRTAGLACRVTATNDVGSASATSDVAYPSPASAVPPPQAPTGGGGVLPPFVLPPTTVPRPGTAKPADPAPTRIRVTGLRLAPRALTLRASAAGRFGVRIDALGSTVRSVRRARIPATQRRSLVVRRAGAARLRLPRTLPVGRYRVRVYPGAARRGTPLATSTARISRRR